MFCFLELCIQALDLSLVDATIFFVVLESLDLYLESLAPGYLFLQLLILLFQLLPELPVVGLRLFHKLLIILFKPFDLSSEDLDLFLKLLMIGSAQQVGGHADAFLRYVILAIGEFLLLDQLLVLLGGLIHLSLSGCQDTQHLFGFQLFHILESPEKSLVLEDQRTELAIVLQDVQDLHELPVVLSRVQELTQNHFLLLSA